MVIVDNKSLKDRRKNMGVAGANTFRVRKFREFNGLGSFLGTCPASDHDDHKPRYEVNVVLNVLDYAGEGGKSPYDPSAGQTVAAYSNGIPGIGGGGNSKTTRQNTDDTRR